jgi:predicted adenylyl cyclase CyaB
MVTEIEQKIRLASDEVTLFEERCMALARKNTEPIIQRDEYFDTSGEELKHGDFALRIRHVPGHLFIALKGPRSAGLKGNYRRIELEFEAPDQDRLQAQLDRQGLIRTALIEKQRREFAIELCSVAIDTVPFIGSFIEIEGPSDDDVTAVKSILGLSAAEPVSENYTELLEKEFLAIGRAIRPQLIATFDSEEGS